MINLTLSSIFLAPGNMMIFAMMLMFVVQCRKLELCLHQKIFSWFVAVSVIGCIFSSHPFVAFGGSTMRCEGLAFWIIACRAAYLFWSCKEDDHASFDSFGSLSVVLPMVFFLLVLLGCSEPATPVMAGGFGAMMFAIMSFINPIFSIFSVSMALFGGCRSALICIVVSLISSALYLGVRVRTMAIVIASLIIVLSSIGIKNNMPAFRKISSFKISGIGQGARIHYIKDSYRVWRHYPFYKKVFGDGFDSIQYHLKNPDKAKYQPIYIPDRTHNMFCDILLQTGFVGIVMFLASLVLAFVTAFKNPTLHNTALSMGLVTWILFGLFNPQGAAAHTVAMICLFGIRSRSNDAI